MLEAQSVSAEPVVDPATTLPKKKCIDCGEVKPLGDFRRNNMARDGRRTECKRCSLARERRENVLPVAPIITATKPPRPCNRCGDPFTPGITQITCQKCWRLNGSAVSDVATNGTFRRGGGGAS